MKEACLSAIILYFVIEEKYVFEVLVLGQVLRGIAEVLEKGVRGYCFQCLKTSVGSGFYMA